MAEVEARARHGCCGSTGTGVDGVKPPRLYGSTCLAVFRRQFEVVTRQSTRHPAKRPHTCLPSGRGGLSTFYTASLLKLRMNRLLRHSRIATGTTNWSLCTAHSWKQGPNSSAIVCKSWNESSRESPLLEADTKQRVREDLADWEDLECAVAICRVYRTVKVL
jgi:hypothetical protein